MNVTVKTAVSRFQIHDELTAPDESAPLIKSIQADRHDSYSIAQHAKSARRAGLGLDEVSRARSFSSGDAKEAALLEYLQATLEADGYPPHHLHEEAREIGWSDEEILEAVAHLALNEFQSLIASAAALPKDQATPEVLPSAA